MSDNAIAPLEDKPNPTYPVVFTSNSKVTVVSSNFHFSRYFPFASKTAECLYPLSWEKVRRTVEKKKAPRKANTNIIVLQDEKHKPKRRGKEIQMLQFPTACVLFPSLHWKLMMSPPRISRSASEPPSSSSHRNCLNLCSRSLICRGTSHTALVVNLPLSRLPFKRLSQ